MGLQAMKSHCEPAHKYFSFEVGSEIYSIAMYLKMLESQKVNVWKGLKGSQVKFYFWQEKKRNILKVQYL